MMSAPLKLVPTCSLDGSEMERVWEGRTFKGAYILAFICTACFSLCVRCTDPEDPTLKMIQSIQVASEEYVRVHR
jgi:hypothetical protein